MSTPTETAHAIVKAIIDDLTNRKGLQDEWDNINEDIQDEIRREWQQIAFEKIVGV